MLGGISGVREDGEAIRRVRWIEIVDAVADRIHPSRAAQNNRLQRVDLVARHRRAPWIDEHPQVARLDLHARRPPAKPHRVAPLLLRPERAGDDAVLAVHRGAGEAVEDDAGADDEVERGVWRGELGRTEADLEGVADELRAEELRAVDAVVLAQLVDPSPTAAPRIAAYLPERAQNLRGPIE